MEKELHKNMLMELLFDSASNMSGIRSGVQALVKRQKSHALYVHCFVRSFEVSKPIDLVRNVVFIIWYSSLNFHLREQPRLKDLGWKSLLQCHNE